MTETVYAYTWGFLFILIYLNLSVCLYVAFAKLAKIESHLENCKLVENNRYIWGGGPIGRMYRLMQIGGMLFFPKIIRKNGEADLEEIRRLPIPLRRWVTFPAGTLIALSAAMIALWGYGEYTGLLE
nr:hypothetical protein [uncultured Halomonas sp.]